jgi:hypothetical protein
VAFHFDPVGDDLVSDNNNHAATETFNQFWGDFFTRMGAPPEAMRMGSPTPGASPEMIKQMQRVFFDAMAKYCDDYMRSEPFLQMMKQTMDRSLAFKQQLDQFLGAAQKGMQAPARADIDDLSGTLLKIEERVLDRLDALETKVAAMGGTRRTARIAGASRAKRPSGRVVSKPKRKKK